ncbi:acyl carrier protein [Criibacterium bergeronii]|uniref:Acyl carrier protein n=1 Tax=Criibacterium bergeronii TaxID=1871336 RepID=A0A371IJ11_9FIRM|nr:acyl carrier protein [Criibacterium bergeronii]MBS6063340.1 acyl carrier protein [Peptostreptococcaceae bacterium]RDY20466.1 acyl carrier protein [Criibacterium bergeronii]
MIFEKIVNIICINTGLSPESISLDSSIDEDLEIDSIDAFEILSEIEDEFSIEVDEDAMSSFKTIRDIVDYVENAV